MKSAPKKQLRCAVYTRKSTDHNLELEFNSLDAQREACEAYIKSQAHEGWRLVPTKYDDGGHSGSSLERPALQKLLEDVRAGKIDVIVVYKIDRLTRSLTDFAKLVEVFDQQTVSFVSITQSFNTTTSMGRLTLNVLLSFAQFEREVISERIQDKVSASKRKGIWVGGPVPIGYHSIDKKPQIVPEEAATVRMLFARYLDLKSISALQEELDRKGILTKRQMLSTGRLRGGCRFGKGTLQYLLRNRFYIGEVDYRGAIHKGEQEPLIDRATFDAVQKLLTEKAVLRKNKLASSDALLRGLLFDDRGNRMTPSHSIKRGARYRYYISVALLESKKDEAGSVARVTATEVEDLVIATLRQQGAISEDESVTRELLQIVVECIEIQGTEIRIELADKSLGNKGLVSVPWQKALPGAPKGVIHAPATTGRQLTPETRNALLGAIARARKWVADIESGQVNTIDEIAKQEGNVERHIRLLLPLAFTPPTLITSLVDGTAPHDLTVTGLAKQVSLTWG
ncbi:MAG: recombinase family protein [Xanthobacteraceae bacterium]|nr:recombinase family protein [Xanthobacteraceae bacterium]QYK45633.1 MAG: recombinase family protein [Xanthobacteraceae bacterium]